MLLGSTKRVNDPLRERAAYVYPSGCHEWIGQMNAAGYGRFRNVYVHRMAWESKHGKIPDGMVIDHICRNRRCFNVEHLRCVTNEVNATENSESPVLKNRLKTHCPNGHEYDAIYKGKHRRCKRCRADWQARYMDRPGNREKMITYLREYKRRNVHA